MTDSLYSENIRTFSGRFINLVSPDPADVFIGDIALHLSRICRFNGATKKWYSVAEHSVWCAEKCQALYPQDDRLAFQLLMHDAHEYVLYDFATPIKSKLVGYGSLATKLQQAIYTRFQYWTTETSRPIIKSIDKQALEWEWNNKVVRWCGLELPPSASQAIFLQKFQELCKTPYVELP